MERRHHAADNILHAHEPHYSPSAADNDGHLNVQVNAVEHKGRLASGAPRLAPGGG